jgi:cysteine desulfurase
VRHGTNILAQEQGGAQERYRRAGTENVPGAVGMAVALELAVAEQPLTVGRLAELRDRLAAALRPLPDVEETGHVNERLPGLASFLARGLDGAAVTTALDLAGLACSTGSACVTGSTEVSHVLTAMGYPEDEARGALRFSLGRTTTSDEIEEAGALIVRTIAVQREAAAKLRTKELVLAATKSPEPDRAADMGAAVE